MAHKDRVEGEIARCTMGKHDVVGFYVMSDPHCPGFRSQMLCHGGVMPDGCSFAIVGDCLVPIGHEERDGQADDGEARNWADGEQPLARRMSGMHVLLTMKGEED